jgi:capsid protein
MAEATTNPVIEGIIDTHAIDVVGPNGPQWLVSPRDVLLLEGNEALKIEFSKYATAAQEALQTWFESPHINGDLTGPEMLEQDIWHQWTCGNSLIQVVNDDAVGRREIGLRWQEIHPERVFTGMMSSAKAGSGNSLVLNVERNSFGKKIAYHVREADRFGKGDLGYKHKRILAANVIHRYVAKEAGQVAGVPWLASSLPVIADLRQFDKFTMETAKLGASLGVIFEDKFQDTVGTNRRVTTRNPTQLRKSGLAEMMLAPSNTEAKQVDPKHPGAQYIPYRAERMRDIGRAVQMPLLIVRLGAEDHSFSSARFDAQIYQRGVRRLQARLLHKYRPSMMDVLREAELIGLIPRRPVAIEITGSFTSLPHVDPKKEADAIAVNLGNMSTTLIDVWQEAGKRPQDQVEKLRRQVTLLNEVKDEFGDKWLLSQIAMNGPEQLSQAEAASIDAQASNKPKDGGK